MKVVRIVPDDQKCVYCEVCELTCSNVNFGVNNPKKSAIQIVRKSSDPEGFEIKVCNQCGLCARKCPEEAISLVNEAYIIDEEKCTLCGICVEVCPTDVIWWRPDIRIPVKCTSCKACVDNCPTNALSISVIEVKGASTARGG